MYLRHYYESLCKPIAYASLFSTFALVGIVSTSTNAQAVPPPVPSDSVKWSGGSSTSSDWEDLLNWVNGSGPPSTSHVLFPHLPSIVQAGVTSTVDRTVASLWFEAGSFYEIQGSSEISLNGGAPGGYLVVLRSDGTRQSEVSIAPNLNLLNGPSGWGLIENYAQGGLSFDGQFVLGDKSVRFGGTGAIRLGNTITGNGGAAPNGAIEVAGNAADGTQPHLVLSGSSEGWSGKLLVQDRGFAIVKTDQALGRGSERNVHNGGTLGLRSHIESPLIYDRHSQNNLIEAWGLGIRRSEDTHQIGAIYNDGGTNRFDMRISMNRDPLNESPVGFGARGDRDGSLELTNEIKGDAPFLKLGPGLVILSNTSGNKNQWDKETLLQAGVLRLANSQVLPTASNLVLAGGILELGYNGFSRNFGTGSSQLRFTGSGGFSAHGGARAVTLGDGGTLTWGSTQHFLGNGHSLLLGSRYADNTITLNNAIDLGSALREVRVERGVPNTNAILSGSLSGTGGLVKTGDGLLHLANSGNSYTGATVIRGGALRGTIKTGSDTETGSTIQLDGGVLGLYADFTRSLGTGADEIHWTGSGGFAAYNGGEVRIRLGGSNYPLNWGETHFVQDGDELRFGHYSANGTVIWENGLNLGGGQRTIRIERGQQSQADVELLGQLTGSFSSELILAGNGRIDITTNNNASMHSSRVSIYGVELRLHGQGRLTAVRHFDLRHGGTLALENTAFGSSYGRIGINSNITLATGALRLSSRDVAIDQWVGVLTLESGANTIELRRDGNQLSQLRAAKLTHNTNSRATLHIASDLGDSLLRLRLDDQPTTTSNFSSSSNIEIIGGIVADIFAWATVGDTYDTWLVPATENGNPIVTGLPHDHYEIVDSVAAWASAVGDNVKTTNAVAALELGAHRSLHSLILYRDLSLGNHTLTISSGGLMASDSPNADGITTRAIVGDPTTPLGTAGSITTGNPDRPLYIHNSGQLTFKNGAAFTGRMDIVKTRGGSLVLESRRQHQIGNLYIHQGSVHLRDGSLQVKDHVTIGDGARTDRLILPGGRSNPITKTGNGSPSITLRGTPHDPRGPEYDSDQAILQLGGDGPTYGAGTKQHLASLTIEGRGTIDFRGGEFAQANILWVDKLTISTGGQLFIRNWYEFEDMLLVKRSFMNGLSESGRAYLLSQIVFEGYQDYQTTLKDYDANYWQISPFGRLPEPSTYGAILGAVGIGLVVWKRKRRSVTAAT